jgi:hypothetical protein
MIEHADERLKVNLLMNRASRWIDLDSYIPYQGRVDLYIKTTLKEISVRLPDWIESGSGELVCEMNSTPRDFKWNGRYVELGSGSSGDTLTIRFPIWERKLERRIHDQPHETVIGGVEYDTIILKGNTVVSIDPPGKNFPLYQRDHYRESEPKWRKVERFISDESISW